MFLSTSRVKKLKGRSSCYPGNNKRKLYIGEFSGTMTITADIEYVSIIDNPKLAIDLESTKALNLIDFYPIPHYNEFPYVEAAHQTI